MNRYVEFRRNAPYFCLSAGEYALVDRASRNAYGTRLCELDLARAIDILTLSTTLLSLTEAEGSEPNTITEDEYLILAEAIRKKVALAGGVVLRVFAIDPKCAVACDAAEIVYGELHSQKTVKNVPSTETQDYDDPRNPKNFVERPVPGFDCTDVSNRGDIFYNGNCIKVHKAKDGTLYVRKRSTGRSAVRLNVAETVLTVFEGRPADTSKKYIPKYLDGDYSNCALANLAWQEITE